MLLSVNNDNDYYNTTYTDKHAMITSTGDVYPYIQQLVASLDAQQPQQKLPHLPADLQQITTPLHPQKWEELLQSYPDREFAQYTVAGLQKGF